MYEDETLQFESFKEMLRLMKIRHCLRFEMTNLFDGKGEFLVSSWPDKNFAQFVSKMFQIHLLQVSFL